MPKKQSYMNKENVLSEGFLDKIIRSIIPKSINKSLEKQGITVPDTDEEFKQMFKDINKLYGIKK